MDPGLAGLALVAGTVPIIVVAPLAGRVFDRVGGRIPLVFGFLVLAASSFWIAWFVSDQEFWILVPGLVLQGIGLGTILTVNDPTGLNAVPRDDRGQAAGVINTAEQLGGAIGIAGLTTILFTTYFDRLDSYASSRGVQVTAEEIERFRAFILRVEEVGIADVRETPFIRRALPLATDSFVHAFEVTMLVVAGIALLGAVCSFVLVRKTDRVAEAPVFSRRSRWVWMAPGQGPGLTRQPAPEPATPVDTEPEKPPAPG